MSSEVQPQPRTSEEFACVRGTGSFSVASSPCRQHSRPMILCALASARALLVKGALELSSDREYEAWQDEVGAWLKEHPV